MAMQHNLQIFCGAETPVENQIADLAKTPNLLVPVRRTSQVPVDEMANQTVLGTAVSLQQQLDQRTAQLLATEEQLMNCNRDFQEFASAVSHDLQAPLRAIAGFSSYLQEEYGSALDDTADEYINQVVGSASRMRQLIDGLVQFSRVSSRGLPLTKLSLNDVLEDALAELQNESNCQNVVIEYGDLPGVVGDYQQLVALFKHLIQNGITFNESENPEVSIRAQRVDGNCVVFVEDNGMGIAEKDLENVFSIFRRLHTREQFDGVGAGLAICRRIARRHGGQIELDSKQGVGTTAVITLRSVPTNLVDRKLES